MLYIGVDTGTQICGVAEVCEVDKLNILNAVTYNLVSLHGKDFDDRLIGLYWSISRRIDEITYKTPRAEIVVGIESPWMGRNAQSSLKLGMAYGIIRAAFLEKGILQVYRIEATEGKKALTGTGNASKKDMQDSVELQFGQKLPEDAADAVAVALAARVKHLEDLFNDS